MKTIVSLSRNYGKTAILEDAVKAVNARGGSVHVVTSRTAVTARPGPPAPLRCKGFAEAWDAAITAKYGRFVWIPSNFNRNLQVD